MADEITTTVLPPLGDKKQPPEYMADVDMTGLTLDKPGAGVPTLVERYGAARENASIQTDAYNWWGKNYLNVLKEAGETAYGDPDAFRKFSSRHGGGEAVAADEFLKKIQSDPAIAAQVKGAVPANWAASRDEATKRARKQFQDNLEVSKRAGGAGAIEMLAGFERAMTDEVGLATAAVGLFTGGSLTTLRAAGRVAIAEGALGAGGELATIPAQQEAAAELGIEGPNVGAQVLLSGGISAAFPMVGYGIGQVGRGLTNRAARRGAEVASDRDAAAAREDAILSPLGQKQGLDANAAAARAISDDDLGSLPQVEMTPEQQVAAATPAPETYGVVPGDAPTGSDAYYARLRQVESGGNDSAQAPGSSAAGRYQFTKGTWDGLRRRRPDLGLTPTGRFDPDQQERAIRAFTEENAAGLRASGVEPTDGDLYLAHFAGLGGARQVMESAPDAPIRNILGAAVIKANAGIRHNGKRFADFTARDLREWAAAKMGGPVPSFKGSIRSINQAGSEPSVGLFVRDTPDKFNVDDSVYQAPFKSDMPSTQPAIERWNDQLAGSLLFHERLDGSRWVVDGRARYEAARRIAAQGDETPMLQGLVLREADGWTADRAAIQGAILNVSRGNDPIEKAAAIRAMPEMADILGTDDAMSLSRLSDADFDSVRAGRISMDDALFMGRDTTPSLERARIANGAAKHLEQGGEVSGADFRAAASSPGAVSDALDTAVKTARADGDDAAIRGLVERLTEFRRDIDGAADRRDAGSTGGKDAPSSAAPSPPDIDLASEPAARAAAGDAAYDRAVEIADGSEGLQRGVFGPIFTGFRGKWREAVERLRQARTGEAPAALTHADVGDIGLVWGDEGAGRQSGYGLAKILKRHPEMLDDLQGRLNAASIVSDSENRIILDGPGGRFVVSRMLGGKPTDKWLLTAYEKGGGGERFSRMPTDHSDGSQSPSASVRNTNSPDASVNQPSERGSDDGMFDAEQIARTNQSIETLRGADPSDLSVRMEMDDGSSINLTPDQLLKDLDDDLNFLDQLNLCKG